MTTWYAVKAGDHSCLILGLFPSEAGYLGTCTTTTQDKADAERACRIWGGHLVTYAHTGSDRPTYEALAKAANTTWKNAEGIRL